MTEQSEGVYALHQTDIEHVKLVPVSAIFVTSGSISAINLDRTSSHDEDLARRIRYRPTSSTETDTRGNFSWGNIRTVAASHLAKEHPQATVVTLSSSNNTHIGFSNEDKPPYKSDAAVAANILKSKGLQNELLIEPRSMDTFTEMLTTLDVALRNGFESINIITTAFQEPRAKAMLHSLLHISDPEERRKIDQMMRFNRLRTTDRDGDLDYYDSAIDQLTKKAKVLGSLKVKIIPAEEILENIHPRFRKIIDEARSHPLYRETLQKDKQAAQQWIEGIYGKIDV